MKWHRGHGDDCALIAPGVTLSYAELDAQVAARIETFRQVGIGAGQRIALFQLTSIDYIVSLLALIERGAVVCPMNTRWPESKVYEAMTQIGAVFLQDVMERGHSVQSIEATHILTDNRWATLVFTSGTSGTPKAAVHSLANHRASAQASNRNISLEPGDCWLLSLPLYHVGGLGILFRCLEAGATVVLPDADQDLSITVQEGELSHISLVSTQLHRLLQDDHATQALAKMKAVLMGGSAIPTRLINEACEAGLPIHTSYGMTETSTQITCTPPEASRDTLATSGQALIEGTVRVNDSGEIEVSGETLFQGYLVDEKTELSLTPDGFFGTGDTGHFDDAGMLHVTGRIDRQFISGGENIQPATIEEALCQLEGVHQAHVIAVDDEAFGQRPIAFVRHESHWEEQAIQEQLRTSLPGFMIPERVLPWPEEMEECMKVDPAQLLALWKKL